MFSLYISGFSLQLLPQTDNMTVRLNGLFRFPLGAIAHVHGCLFCLLSDSVIDWQPVRCEPQLFDPVI